MSKLVRDKIPELIIKDGKFPITTWLNIHEYKDALIDKLFEETHELAEAASPSGNRQAVLEEAADVLEVVLAILADYNFLDPLDALLKKRVEKWLERGGFSKGISLIEVKDKPTYEFGGK